jgi:WD repeat-containing protein 68
MVCQVEIIQLNEDDGDFRVVGSFDHPYPPTKVMWIPDEVR